MGAEEAAKDLKYRHQYVHVKCQLILHYKELLNKKLKMMRQESEKY